MLLIFKFKFIEFKKVKFKFIDFEKTKFKFIDLKKTKFKCKFIDFERTKFIIDFAKVDFKCIFTLIELVENFKFKSQVTTAKFIKCDNSNLASISIVKLT